MNRYSYDSETVKEIFSREESTYSADDWKFLAEFHQYHHREWIEISMALLKDDLSSKIAYDKLHKHFLVRFGLLPKRIKVKGLLNAVRGRPRKDKEREAIKVMIAEMKLRGLKDSDCLDELISRGILHGNTDIRTFTRIKNGK